VYSLLYVWWQTYFDNVSLSINETRNFKPVSDLSLYQLHYCYSILNVTRSLLVTNRSNCSRQMYPGLAGLAESHELKPDQYIVLTQCSCILLLLPSMLVIVHIVVYEFVRTCKLGTSDRTPRSRTAKPKK
jgi:hypothetical protein